MRIKILIITSGLTAGGVDTLILNTLSEMNHDKFQIDLLIFNGAKDDWSYKFEKYGCKIIKLPRAREQGFLKSVFTYKKVIERGEYNLIHSHIGFGSVLPVIACALTKDCYAITHAHYDDFQVSKSVELVGHILFNIFPCKKLACSYGAGNALYGKGSKFEFIKNGIDSEKFSYDPQIRDVVRKELGLADDCFVVGTVGRMEYQKNHEFLLKIFREIKAVDKKSKLVLVGDGELRTAIQSQVNELKLQEDVVFLGIRNDVYRILQALDVFIMPTRFEGLSLALLEVECSGLPCLTSDVVPREAKVTDNFHFISLSDDPKDWAERALAYRNVERKNGVDMIKNAGFDKKQAAQSWFRVYLDTLDERKIKSKITRKFKSIGRKYEQ